MVGTPASGAVGEELPGLLRAPLARLSRVRTAGLGVKSARALGWGVGGAVAAPVPVSEPPQGR
eukprot:5498118-Alexandrium_andersonii.AAC.1